MRWQELEQGLLARETPCRRPILGGGKHPQLAERHRALLRRFADQARELDARQPGRAEFLNVEQCGVQRDDVGAARRRATRSASTGSSSCSMSGVVRCPSACTSPASQAACRRRKRDRAASSTSAPSSAGRASTATRRSGRAACRRTAMPPAPGLSTGDESSAAAPLAARSLEAARARPHWPARAKTSTDDHHGGSARDVARPARREQREQRRDHAEPRRQAAGDDTAGTDSRRRRAAEEERNAEAERERRAPRARQADRRRAIAQHLIPTWSATTPALRLWTSTWPKPAVFIIAFSVAWSGWTRIDSARYL